MPFSLHFRSFSGELLFRLEPQFSDTISEAQNTQQKQERQQQKHDPYSGK